MQTKASAALVVLSWLACQSSWAQSEGLDLQVQVQGAQPSVGQIILSLFDSPENYLSEPIVELIQRVDENGGAAFVLENLPVATYAISAVYDEDSDGELDTGFLGIPTEKVGMSNNAKSTFGPPSFEKAAFHLSESATISINLGNAKD
jgi:uncharacterized protein (DUF2141 family)